MTMITDKLKELQNKTKFLTSIINTAALTIEDADFYKSLISKAKQVAKEVSEDTDNL